MRVLIIGSLAGDSARPARIAMARGAELAHADDVEHGARPRCAPASALDLAAVRRRARHRRLVRALAAERIAVPVVACGIGADADAAVRAIRAGARNSCRCRPTPS